MTRSTDETSSNGLCTAGAVAKPHGDVLTVGVKPVAASARAPQPGDSPKRHGDPLEPALKGPRKT